jgi:hypothetical protein
VGSQPYDRVLVETSNRYRRKRYGRWARIGWFWLSHSIEGHPGKTGYKEMTLSYSRNPEAKVSI